MLYLKSDKSIKCEKKLSFCDSFINGQFNSCPLTCMFR